VGGAQSWGDEQYPFPVPLEGAASIVTALCFCVRCTRVRAGWSPQRMAQVAASYQRWHGPGGAVHRQESGPGHVGASMPPGVRERLPGGFWNTPLVSRAPMPAPTSAAKQLEDDAGKQSAERMAVLKRGVRDCSWSPANYRDVWPQRVRSLGPRAHTSPRGEMQLASTRAAVSEQQAVLPKRHERQPARLPASNRPRMAQRARRGTTPQAKHRRRGALPDPETSREPLNPNDPVGGCWMKFTAS